MRSLPWKFIVIMLDALWTPLSLLGMWSLFDSEWESQLHYLSKKVYIGLPYINGRGNKGKIYILVPDFLIES